LKKRILAYAVIILSVVYFYSSEVHAEEKIASTKSDWQLMHGNSSDTYYRFIEQYGEHRNLLTGESKRKQRLDFTYSKKHGWTMYLKTHLLADENDLIVLSIDDEIHMFKGQGCCHKQAFLLDEKVIGKLRNAESLLIEEIYYADNLNIIPSFKYQSKFSTLGLSEALDWAKTQ